MLQAIEHATRILNTANEYYDGGTLLKHVTATRQWAEAYEIRYEREPVREVFTFIAFTMQHMQNDANLATPARDYKALASALKALAMVHHVELFQVHLDDVEEAYNA